MQALEHAGDAAPHHRVTDHEQLALEQPADPRPTRSQYALPVLGQGVAIAGERVVGVCGERRQLRGQFLTPGPRQYRRSRRSTSVAEARNAASSSSNVRGVQAGSGSSALGSTKAGRAKIMSGEESRPRARSRRSRRHGVSGWPPSASMRAMASVSAGLTTTRTPSALASGISTSVSRNAVVTFVVCRAPAATAERDSAIRELLARGRACSIRSESSTRSHWKGAS